MFVPMLFVLWARNYASYECGSKVIAANSEAEGTPRILNEMMDEYLLNPCKAQIWFIVELCESIQPLGFELANYELFSSTPKDFTVYGSENYPTREWINLGSFTAQDVRTIQRFELQSQSRFFKYMKVEMKSHYGAEHYCPLSVIRFFGTSMVEEFDAIENGGTVEKNLHFTEVENLASYESSQSTAAPTSSQSQPANLIGTAREVVMNMVRKAAMALSKFPSQEAESFNKSDLDPLTEQRTSDVLQLSLSSIKLMPWLDKILQNCRDCGGLFVDPITSSSSCSDSTPNQKLCDYIKVLLGLKTYAILCEEVNKEPTLRFRCPLQSYFINTTHPLSISGGGPDELHASHNLVPSYLNNVANLPDHLSTQSQSIDNITQRQSVSDHQTITQQPFIVETVSPSSVIEGSLLSSITSVLFEPNHNESENLKPSELITDLVNNTLNTPTFDNETEKVSGQSIDSSSFSIESNKDKSSEETPTLSSPSLSSSTIQSTASQLPSQPQPQQQQQQPNQAQQQQASTPGASQPIAPTNTANWVPLSASQAKESVFIRMSNKIKSLEVNLTLSNQILEDLSQKYKRNMDEMQRIMNETIIKLNETATMAMERDIKKQEILDDLSTRLSLAEDRIALFIAEKESMHWSFIGVHIVLLIIEIIIILSIVSICVKRASARLAIQYRDHLDATQTSSTNTNNQNGFRGHSGSISLKRPNLSVESFKPSPAKSKRIEEDLIVLEPTLPLNGVSNGSSKNKKKRKKKKGNREEIGGGDLPGTKVISRSTENLPSTTNSSSKSSKDYLKELNLQASSSYKFVSESNFIGFQGKPSSCENISRGNNTTNKSNNSNQTNSNSQRRNSHQGKIFSKSNSSSSSGISSLSSNSNSRVLKEKQASAATFNYGSHRDKETLKSSINSLSSSPSKSSFSWKKLLKLEKK